MKYVSKQLIDTLRVTGIVNLHFFEFDNDFTTVGERHPFYELVFVNSGKLYISSEDYVGELDKDQLIIHRQNTVHSLRCPTNESTSVIIIGFECDSEIIDTFSYKPTEPSTSVIRQLAEIVKEGRNVFKPPYNAPVYDMKKKKHQPKGAEQMLRILLECLLIRLLRGHSQGESDQKRANMPLMIQEMKTSSIPGTAAALRQMERMFRLTSGSPPVMRSFRMPSEAAVSTARIISSSVSMSVWDFLQMPSSGMQYRHRRLQSSVTESRR